MDSHRIDVLLPTYNSGQFLQTTLVSIQEQTVKDIRIIVIDDGSTDATASLVKQMATEDPRILYIWQKNAGIVSALNAGIALCVAPFIARHDADDLSDSDRFQRQLEFLETNADCAAVSALARHIDESGTVLKTVTTLKDLATADDSSVPAVEPYLLHPMLMLRRSALEEAGGYRYVHNAEDSDLYWRLNGRNRLHIIPSVLGSYRLHAGSVTSASIVSGRQTAVWSQLSALSAQRRRLGQPDLTFDAEFMGAVKKRVSFQAIYDAACQLQNLTSDEKTWLASASAAKLMELTYYRPFEPDAADIVFIRKAIAADASIKQRRGYKVLEEGILSASIRILISKRPRDALALTEPLAWPALVVRTAFRVGVPVGLKDRIKRSIRGKQGSRWDRGSHTVA